MKFVLERLPESQISEDLTKRNMTGETPLLIAIKNGDSRLNRFDIKEMS